MGFDSKKFRRAKWQPRTGVVAVPLLAGFFDEGEAAQITVRGLTLDELARSRESINKTEVVGKLAGALANNKGAEAGEAIAEAMGLPSESVADDTAVKMGMMQLGILEPAMELPDIVTLCEVAPIEAGMVVAEIMRLTGLGKQMAGSTDSG